MFARHKVLILVLFVSLLVTGCGSAEPTATPVPATVTQIALEPTETPLPPTDTAVPATATAVPPTPTDTPLPPPTDTPLPPTAAPSATPTPVPLVSLEAVPQLFENTETVQVGLGDLDGDGDLDAVFANMGSNDSQIWLNDGGAQGGTPGQFVDSGQRLTQQGHGVGLGDLDGDGDLDIFMTCAHYDPGGGWRKKPSKVYLNAGGAQGGTPGTFHDSGQDLGDTELSGTGLKLVDLDGDGDLDAHVIYYEVGGMADRVYLNDGAGRFSDSGLALTEDVIAWGDLDADGDLDILAKTLGQGYGVLLNDGTGQFAAGWSLENRQTKRGDIALADFDADGDLDALVANGSSSEGSYPTRLLWNDGGGRFTDSGQALNETSAAKFDVGDLDRDGSLDVFVSNVDRPNEVWLNDGRGQFTDSGLRLEGSSRKLTTRPSLGDLDGDGDLDVMVAGFQGKVEVWINRTALPTVVDGGGEIVFISTQDGNDEIYVMNADGSDQRNLSRHPASEDDVRWSPDGSRIVFSSDRSGNYEIYVMDADGTNLQQLTQNLAIDAQPAWSPDGTQIAFVTRRYGNVEICVIAVPDGTDVDGSNLQRVTHTEANEFEFDWSPDGAQIVFARADGAYADIYVMNFDGSDLRQLTDSDGHDFYPRWSPDGEQIAFLSTRDGGREEIYVMAADGSNQRRLTNNKAFDGAPSWSPDGTRFVFASDRDGNYELYVMNSDGTDVQRLTDNRAADRKPSWRPRGATNGSAGTWIRTFDGPDYGAFFDVVLTADGNVLAVGATNHLHTPPYSGDALIMELTLEGDLLWQRIWGGDGYEQAMSVVLAGDGGSYVFGETDSYGAGGRDFFLLKMAEDGNEEWFKTYDRARREWPYGMLRLANGDLLIYGFTEPEAGSGRNQYVLRLGPGGEVVWEHIVDGPEEELVIDALEMAEGDLVLAVVVEEDGKLVKLDADGNVRWTKRYELDGWQFASRIAPVDDGGFLLAGFSMSSGSRRQADTWLARCTVTGELAWERSFGDSAFDDYAHSLIRLGDGTYLMGSIGNGMLLSRIDQEGNLLWW